MKKNIIIAVILIILFLGAAGILYLNNVYLPVKIKGQIINAIETSLGFNAGIEKIKFSLLRGLIVQDISIFDKVKNKENTLLSVKEIHFNFLLLPLFKERKIIIPVIYVESPEILIRYKNDNTFNFSKIFPLNFKTQDPKKNGFSLVVFKINLIDAKCAFADEHFSPTFRKNLEDMRLSIGINPFANISFLLKAKLALNEKTNATLSMQGEYDINKKEVKAELEFSSLLIPEFNPYLKNLPVNIESGNIETANFELKFKDWVIGLKGKAQVKNLALKKDNFTFGADIDLEPELNYSPIKKELDYKSGIKLIRADLGGVPGVGKISGISGDINLAKDILSTENLKFETADSAFILKGTLENFNNPFLKANLASEQLNLEKIFALFPHPQDLKLSGISKAGINIAGALQKMPLDITASFDLIQAQLQNALLKEPINNIQGKIDFTPGAVNWQALSFNYNNTAYSCDGKITDLLRPRIKFALNSKDLVLKSDLRVTDKSITLNAVNGTYLDSKFYFKGGIDTQDKNNPSFDLDAKINADISDALSLLLLNTKETIRKAKLEGKLNITASLTGKAKDYKDWDLSSKVSSDTVSLYNLKFNNLNFSLEQKDRLIQIPLLSASSYSGTIRLQGNASLKSDTPDYFLKLNASGINLAELKNDLNLKDKDIAGTLSIDANLEGDFNGADNLKGKAVVSVEDGKLWELNLLKGLGDLVFLPDYEKISFNQANGIFEIGNKSVTTDDLELKSEQLKLNCKGKVGFDGTLDMTIYNEVNKDLIKDSGNIHKFVTAVLGELGDSIVVKVSGTLQKPKYSIVPLPVDVIKSIKDFLLGK